MCPIYAEEPLSGKLFASTIKASCLGSGLVVDAECLTGDWRLGKIHTNEFAVYRAQVPIERSSGCRLPLPLPCEIKFQGWSARGIPLAPLPSKFVVVSTSNIHSLYGVTALQRAPHLGTLNLLTSLVFKSDKQCRLMIASMTITLKIRFHLS